MWDVPSASTFSPFVLSNSRQILPFPGHHSCSFLINTQPILGLDTCLVSMHAGERRYTPGTSLMYASVCTYKPSYNVCRYALSSRHRPTQREHAHPLIRVDAFKCTASPQHMQLHYQTLNHAHACTCSALNMR